MFGIFAPITYNTDLSSLFAGYYTPFYAGGYSPFAPLFNPQMSYYGNTGMYYSYFYNYGCNNFSNIFSTNYAPQVNYSACGGGTSVKPSSTTVQKSKTSSAISASSTRATKPVKSVRETKTADNKVSVPKPVDLGTEFVSVARKYSNCTEFDGSHLKFCNNPTCKIEDPENEEWCTDFVTYVAKEVYRNKGLNPPAGFGDHDVRTMKSWAIQTNRFIRTSNKSQKGKFIAENIKPGDIMIINENNASHTGFVTKIDKNSGVIHTIEGNRDDRVKEHSYSPNYPDLSGFIRLTS